MRKHDRMICRIGPPDPFDITQAQNAIDQAQRDLDQAQVSTTQQTVSDAQSLQTTLDGTYSSISNYFGDAPNNEKNMSITPVSIKNHPIMDWGTVET